MIALITFRDKQLREIRLIPINVKNAEVVFQPQPLTGPDAVEAMAQVQQLSLARGTVLEYRDDSAILTLSEQPGN
jgi:poly-gamma-glutamate synthesis protein (capsule biosynthesis protein)